MLSDNKIWLLLAGINGFLAVGMNAFGSHGLEATVSPEQLILFREGADYQMSHALALLGTGVLSLYAKGREQGAITYAGIGFQTGILFFSGSLYWLGIMGPGSLGPLSILTPIGGLALLAGWAFLSIASFRVLWPGLSKD